jgi:hypothetical protein
MAKDDLTGNMPSEQILISLSHYISSSFSKEHFKESQNIAQKLFS